MALNDVCLFVQNCRLQGFSACPQIWSRSRQSVNNATRFPIGDHYLLHWSQTQYVSRKVAQFHEMKGRRNLRKLSRFLSYSFHFSIMEKNTCNHASWVARTFTWAVFIQCLDLYGLTVLLITCLAL
jgi:hypothetical protein